MIRFRMVRLHTPQFAILADKIDGRNFKMETTFSLKYTEDAKSIGVDMLLRLNHGETDQPLVVMQIFCEFEIHPEDLETCRHKNKTIIPKQIIDLFLVQTVGAARGILAAKTEDVYLGGIILPPINVSEFIAEDFVIAPQDQLP
ncbi:MAG: hypothetical protein HUK09_08900 [Bacteroidaceae bacterium]|nr:hypothetical protein [Bacteroidaceae bacterium]